jgi:hypothetical protein
VKSISELRTTLAVTSRVFQLLVTANAVPSSLILSISLVFPRNVLQLLVIANVVPSSLIPFTLMMEVTCSSETSVLTALFLKIPC